MSLQNILERYLGECVRASFEREKPFVIGVAGSVGKSSTKTAIGIALGADEVASTVVATKKNYNNELGIPLTVFGCDAPGRSPFAWGLLLMKASLSRVGILHLRAKMFVLEMATDHPGDIKYLTSIARPNVGVLTAIGPEHTEYFGTIESVAGEESMILRALDMDDVAVINADDDLVRTVATPLHRRTFSFGTSEEATARIVECRMVVDAESPDNSGLEIKLAMLGSTWNIRLTGTVGRPQAYAIAAALATVCAIDGDERLAVQRLTEQFHGMPGRMRLLEGIKRTWLIDDSYNSSPLAARSAIRDLAAFPVAGGGKRIAALGDMLELGQLAESAHADMGRAVAEYGIDMLVVCGTLAHVVADAARAAGMAEEQIFTYAESREAGRFIQEKLKQNDVVLVKGSQGSRMERIAKELMAHPDHAEELLVRHTPEWLVR